MRVEGRLDVGYATFSNSKPASGKTSIERVRDTKPEHVINIDCTHYQDEYRRNLAIEH